MNANQTSTEAAAGKSAAKPFSRHIPTIVRVLMGLMFVVFGLNGFLNFIPQPKTPMPEGAMAFAGALMKTGYMMPLVMGTQLLVGILLLLNLFVPLALALIAPILVGIITFHIFLQPAGLAPGAVILVMELYLAWSYRQSFRPMLAMRATPGVK
ncbi:MAG TPA: DoxX family membrane protein [Verrucomicrobiae bacterium]|nr:DoxX family membrane protein [Verrucomicrobiae bacterium]